MKKIVKYPVFDVEQTYIGTTAEEIDNIQYETEQDMCQRYGIGWDDGVEIILDETMPYLNESIPMDVLYRETDWGVYKFYGLKKIVVDKVLELSEKYPDDTIVNVWVDSDSHDRSEYMFDADSVYVNIYYHQFNHDLLVEIENESIIMENWTDTDAYTFTTDMVMGLREEGIRSKKLLKDLIAMSNNFNEMLYHD